MVLSEKRLLGGVSWAHFPNKHATFWGPNSISKHLATQLRELTTFSGDALEHVDCAIHNLEKQSVDNVVDVVVGDDDDDDDDDNQGNDKVVNVANDDDDGKNEEVTKRFGDNDEV